MTPPPPDDRSVRISTEVPYRRRRLTAAAGLAIATALVAAMSVNRDVGLDLPESRLAQSGLLDDAQPGNPGELIITPMSGTRASEELLRRVAVGEVGGVILMRRNIRTREQVRVLTQTLQRAAHRGGHSPLLIMVDQEGGRVRRFTDLPPRPSARQMARWSPTRIRQMGRATGRALRSVGVNVDLAPVADVPTTSDNFLGNRAFARRSERVAVSACAFARGLRDVGVVATLKHFPGLGGAGRASTDTRRVTITLPLTRLRADLAAYTRCGGEPATLAMMSSAAYRPLTGPVPAVVSEAAYELAAQVGESGPFITDDLSARGLAGSRRLPTRAVRAGADLLLFTSERASRAAYRELTQAGTDGSLDPAVLTTRALNVRQLRRQLLANGP